MNKKMEEYGVSSVKEKTQGTEKLWGPKAIPKTLDDD